LPITYTNAVTGDIKTLYEGVTNLADQTKITGFLSTGLAPMLQAKVPQGVGLRFVGANTPVNGGYVLRVVPSGSTPSYLGDADLNARNANPTLNTSEPGRIYAGHIRRFIYNSYHRYMIETEPDILAFLIFTWDNIPLPMGLDRLTKLYVNIGIHESGHMVGLVAEDYLAGGYNDHNPTYHPYDIMCFEPDLLFEIDILPTPKRFNEPNVNYLKFTLPKP